MSVIMKFVTLAAICKFDDMYAASLQENKMQVAGGKKLKRYYFRRMGFMAEDSEIEFDEKDTDYIPEYENSGSTRPVGFYKGKAIYANPTKGSCCLGFMRFLVKSMRVFYVSTFYYFMPFVFIFLTFLDSMKQKDWTEEISS